MPKKYNEVSVIDVFAGPGGLGEGFSSCDNSPFKIKVSVEFEAHAHKTLTLRSLYRKLTDEEKQQYYIPYIQSINETQKKLRFKNMISANGISAKWQEAQHETLGSPHALGNNKEWAKIKAGEIPTSEDLLPTEQEERIYKRITEVRKEARRNGNPIVLIGGPPCQAYSVNGRNRIRAEKNYKPENDERFFLYQEYLKVIDTAEPDIFVMENVEGILSAKLATGELIFDKIKEEIKRKDTDGVAKYHIYSLVTPPEPVQNSLNEPKYKADNDYVINASQFGIPQARKRVILLGVRADFGQVEAILPKKYKTPTAGQLISDLPKLRSMLSKRSGITDTEDNWQSIWYNNIEKLRTILSDEKEIQKVAERFARSVQASKPSLSKKDLLDILVKRKNEVQSAYQKIISQLNELKQLGGNEYPAGNQFFLKSQTGSTEPLKNKSPKLHDWLIRDIGGVTNHMTRGHMKEDLLRYMFSALWTRAHAGKPSPFPKSKDYPPALSPEHKNWESGHQADRFRAIGADMIPLTITSHLRKDGHAQIHFDPLQNRSMTVREAARIQTFPDDYYFEGPQGWQYQQVGNAVPPFLAKQIAEKVIDILSSKKLL